MFTENFSSLGLESVPTYHPQGAEFDCPLKYIASIRRDAEKYGLCKIIPPRGWKPPFAINKSNFSFKTKVQSIHQLQERPAGCDPETFQIDYEKFCKDHDLELIKMPVFEGGELDLCRLYSAVRRRGGYKKVTEQKKWREVYKMLFSDDEDVADVSESTLDELQSLYGVFLAHYEQQQIHPGTTVDISTEHKKKFKVVQKRALSSQEENAFSLPLSLLTSADVLALFDEPLNANEGKNSNSDPVRVLRKKQRLEEGSGGLGKQLKQDDEKCQHCGDNGFESVMLTCDRCGKGWHMHCLSPPLQVAPPGNWYCMRCVNNKKDNFGFGTGDEHTFSSFARFAESFKKKWFGNDKLSSLRPADIEKEFWNIVENAPRQAAVLYGSDIDTGKLGSGFPKRTVACPPGENKQLWQKYANSPWNLNNIAKLEGSVLKFFDDDISGVIVPWLYIGMMFSAFCWHFEDHSLYSINYLHWGEPKLWYGVPGSAANMFEDVMKSCFPDLFETQPDLLFQLVTMLNPKVLKQNGVPVYSCLQEPGEFVITFPRSYHGGLNLGFNCAEAVNFAPPDWLPWGASSIERFRHYRRSAILSQEEMLFVVARSPDEDSETRNWVNSELKNLIELERYHRNKVWVQGTTRSKRLPARKSPNRITKEEDSCCIICRYFLHVSALTCSCKPKKAVCLKDSEFLCECPASEKRLLYRYSIAELEELLEMTTKNVVSQNSRPLRSRRNSKLASEAELSLEEGSASIPVVPLPKLQSKEVRGQLVSHSEAAESWANEVKAAMQRESPPLYLVEDLLERSDEFLWGGKELSMEALGIKESWEKLTRAKQWADDVAHCCGAMIGVSTSSSGSHHKKDPRGKGLPMAKAEALLSESPLPCMDPRVQELSSRLREVQNFREKVLRALVANPPVEYRTLHNLYNEALRSPIEIPELKVLKDGLSKTVLWAEAVRRLLPTHKAIRKKSSGGSTALANLLRLKTDGDKLLARMQEHSLLQKAISSIELWKVKVETVLEGKPSAKEVLELLEGADSLPVAVSEAIKLSAMLKEAESWKARERKAISVFKGGASLGHLNTDELEKLIGEAFSLPIHVDTSDLEGEVRKMHWMKECSEILLTEADFSAFQYLLQKADSFHIHGPLVDELQKRVKTLETKRENEISWPSQPQCSEVSLVSGES